MEALLKAGADVNGRIQSHPWYMVYTGCGNRNCGLADNSGSTPFWRAAYSVDVDAMKLLVKLRRRPNIPTMAPGTGRFAAAAAVRLQQPQPVRTRQVRPWRRRGALGRP